MDTSEAKLMAHKLRLSGKSVKEIASTVGKSEKWVRLHTKKAAKSHRISMMIKAFKLSKSGKSISEISSHLGISRQLVSKLLEEFADNSVEFPQASDPSETRVLEMREAKFMIDVGIHPIEIAEITGMSRDMIRDITYLRSHCRSGDPVATLCEYKNGVWEPSPQFAHDWTFDITPDVTGELSAYREKQAKSNQLLMLGVSVEDVSRRLGISRAEVIEMQEI